MEKRTDRLLIFSCTLPPDPCELHAAASQKRPGRSQTVAEGWSAFCELLPWLDAVPPLEHSGCLRDPLMLVDLSKGRYTTNPAGDVARGRTPPPDSESRSDRH
jgi:hypothetical protein